MEPFKYKFNPEDIHKKWVVFSGPKEIVELIDQRNVVLEKEKITFMEQMKIAQDEFKEQVESMDRTISNFYQYQNINQHEEVAKIVQTINENLNQF
jgi:dynein heavy chain